MLLKKKYIYNLIFVVHWCLMSDIITDENNCFALPLKCGRTCGERIIWPCDQIACTILSWCVFQLCIQLRFVDIKYKLNLNVIIIFVFVSW